MLPDIRTKNGSRIALSVTLRELLKTPLLKGITVLAGHRGLDRRVNSVTVLDAPDGVNWTQDGELVITSGYIFRDDPMNLIPTLNVLQSRGMSCFGIKVSRYIGKVPDEVLRHADELGIPFLDIPFRFAFRDIIDPVLTTVVNRQAEQLRLSESVLRSFSEIMMNGGPTAEIVMALRRFIGCDLAFVDTTFGENILASRNPSFDSLVRDTSLPQLLSSRSNVSVTLGSKTYGYLIFDVLPEEPRTGYEWDICVDHAKTVLLLSIQKRIAQTEAERRYRDEFVQDILFNNLRFEKEVWNRAKMFSWDLSGPQVAVDVDIDNYKIQFENFRERESATLIDEGKKRIYAIAAARVQERFPKTPYAELSDSIVFILPARNTPPAEFRSELNALAAELQSDIRERTHFTVTVGIGGVKESVFQCHQSYDEARKGLEMVRTSYGGGRIVFWEELGVYKLLGPLFNSRDAVAFYTDYIGPLIEYDRKKHGELVKTLEALIRHNWQGKQAAADLKIHYNTMKYRFGKIRELIGLDINDGEQRLDIALSLKLYMMNSFFK